MQYLLPGVRSPEQKRAHFAIQKRHFGHFDSSRSFAPKAFFFIFFSSL